MKMNNGDFYKNKYFIVFYDANDEEFIASYDNVRQICFAKYGKITKYYMNLTSVELTRAVARKDGVTFMLDGTKMHVHLILAEDID